MVVRCCHRGENGIKGYHKIARKDNEVFHRLLRVAIFVFLIDCDACPYEVEKGRCTARILSKRTLLPATGGIIVDEAVTAKSRAQRDGRIS